MGAARRAGDMARTHTHAHMTQTQTDTNTDKHTDEGGREGTMAHAACGGASMPPAASLACVVLLACRLRRR